MNVFELSQPQAPEAVAALVEQHYSGSLRLARSILRHDTEADDVVQAAYGNALKHLGSFRQEASFSTWISRIVVNQCLMRLRQMKRAPVVSIDALPSESPTPLFPASRLPGPDEVFDQQEKAKAIQRALARLPETLRQPWMLHEIEGLNMRELSETLGISIAAVKSRLFRARAELRKILTVLLGSRELVGAS